MAELTQEVFQILRDDFQQCIPQLSINCVVFRFDGEALQVPIVKTLKGDIWTIPGGFIHQNEGIDKAANRILNESLHIDSLILSQFGTFGPADRNFGKEINATKILELPKDIAAWISQRFITIGYYSVLGRQSTTALKPHPFFKEFKWVNIKEANILAMDHFLLVSEARKVLCSELLSRPLLLSFMDETFTIPELQKLYEAILDRPVDRGNFRQRMLKTGFLTKIGVSKAKTKNRPPILYQLNKEKYLNALTQDVKLGF